MIEVHRLIEVDEITKIEEIIEVNGVQKTVCLKTNSDTADTFRHI